MKKPDGNYSHKKMPPMEFDYQRHEWNSEVKMVTQEAFIHAPTGIEQAPYQFVAVSYTHLDVYKRQR